MDEEYKFYYDETNNIRKFRFKEEGGLNIPIEHIVKNFVLGGIVYKKDIVSFDFEKLKISLYLDKNNNEIKFKHIAKGSFLDCLKSKKLNVVLNWLFENNLYIHFSSLNILYWSIVDIIDSCIGYYPDFRYEDSNYFKTVFYELSKIDLAKFLKILHKYKYPNVQRNKSKKFIIEIKSYILKNKAEVVNKIDAIDEHAILVLADILRISIGKELNFIHDNKNYELIDRFANFYMRPLGLFKNSEHIFDEEKKVKEYFDLFEFLDGDKAINHFDFESSHENILIQISDVVVGILGKYHEFINETEFNDITDIRNKLNNLQIDNIVKLLKLCLDAELHNKAFIHYITSLTNIEKDRLLSLKFISEP